MRNSLIILVIVIGLVVTLGSRFGGMLFYWWFAIFRPLEWIYIDLHFLRISLIVGILVIGLCLLNGLFPRLSHPLAWGMLLFLFLQAVSTFVVGCGAEGRQALDALGRSFLMLFLTNRLVNKPKQLFWLLAVFAVSFGFYSGKAGFFSLLEGGADISYHEGLGGSFRGSNAYAMGSGMTVFLLLVTAQNVVILFSPTGDSSSTKVPAKLKWLRAAIYATVPLSAFNVMSLFSRGSAVGLACGALMFVMLQKRRAKFILFAIPMMLVAYLAMPVPEGYDERLRTITVDEEQMGRSAGGRIHFWRVAVRMATSNPLGVGTKCYMPYYDQYDFLNGRFGELRSVHSSHFQVLAEIGFFGAALWVWLLLNTFRVLYRVRSKALTTDLPEQTRQFLFTYANGLMTALTVFVVGGTFYELAYNEFTWLIVISATVLERFAANALAEAQSDTSAKMIPKGTKVARA